MIRLTTQREKEEDDENRMSIEISKEGLRAYLPQLRSLLENGSQKWGAELSADEKIVVKKVEFFAAEICDVAQLGAYQYVKPDSANWDTFRREQAVQVSQEAAKILSQVAA